MSKKKNPEDVAATIQRSIEVSPKGSRLVHCDRLRDHFGFRAWTAERKELVTGLLESRGIRAQPPLSEARLKDKIVLSLPVMPSHPDSSAGPTPAEEWFEHLTTVALDSEREVELHFASPLFHALGYTDEQEAAGFRFDMWEGVNRKRAEADLVYFADGHHSLSASTPLVLVETKGVDQPPDAGTGQARSYSFWIKPAYYVTTNGNVVVVYNYQGGAVPDVKVLDFERSQLRERFVDLYRVLSPKAAVEARQAKIDKLRGSNASVAHP